MPHCAFAAAAGQEMSTRNLVATVAALSIGVAAWLAWFGVRAPVMAATAAAAPRSAAAALIEVAPVEPAALPLADALPARVAYDEDATARVGVSFAGRIVALRAAPGDVVARGQVLAVVDSPDYGAALADLDKARADAENKRRVLERAQALAPGAALSSREVDAAAADAGAARAEAERAAQRVRNMNPSGRALGGQLLALTAPIGGVVTERNANPGLEVAPGLAAPLFVVSDARRRWLWIDVPESLLGRVHPQMDVEVASDAYPGALFHARVVEAGTLIDPNTRRASARAELVGAGARLLPEMFVRAALREPGRGAQALKVPNTAIVFHGRNAYVYAADGRGAYRCREVTIGVHGSDFSYVTAGLRPGERVVTAGALLLDAASDGGVAAAPGGTS